MAAFSGSDNRRKDGSRALLRAPLHMPASFGAQSVPSLSQSPESQEIVEGVMHLPFPLQI
jgi:hypothetical protein